jgi:hypothetical protein
MKCKNPDCEKQAVKREVCSWQCFTIINNRKQVHIDTLSYDDKVQFLTQYYQCNGNTSILSDKLGMSSTRINKYMLLFSKDKSIMAQVRFNLRQSI